MKMKSYISTAFYVIGSLIIFSQSVTSQSSNTRELGTDDNDFVYSNPNDNYSPNQYVKFGAWMSRNDEFEANENYLKNSGYMPVILAGLGILAFLVINLFFLFRCCCTCIKCLPDETKENYKTNRFRVLMWFYFILFACLAFDQLMFLGKSTQH